MVKPPNCVSRGTAILCTLVWICSFVCVSVYVSICVCACPKRPLKGSQFLQSGQARLDCRLVALAYVAISESLKLLLFLRSIFH